MILLQKDEEGDKEEKKVEDEEGNLYDEVAREPKEGGGKKKLSRGAMKLLPFSTPKALRKPTHTRSPSSVTAPLLEVNHYLPPCSTVDGVTVVGVR